MRRKNVSPFAGAPVKRSYTQKHEPLIWECMLGTVYARSDERGHEDGMYFDYDYEAAHAYVGLHEHWTDLRVCRVHYQYQGWPRKGKWALFGVLKKV